MNDYPVPYAIRYALWRAYEMKCFYCSRPVEFADLTIDHILPRNLAENSNELARILDDYGIISTFPSFSIEGLSNQVPAHGPSCNLPKSDAVFPKHAALFYLTLAYEKLPRVSKELDRLSVTARRGNVLAELAMLLEQGDRSQFEVTAILRESEFRRTCHQAHHHHHHIPPQLR